MKDAGEKVLAAPRLDHGAIGNGSVLALVSPTSAIEWLCLPRFDSPSVFGRLLDAARGGTFRVLVDGEERRGDMRYLRNTNVLSTTFTTDSGVFEVIDFAPRLHEGRDIRAPLEIVRLLRPKSGAPRITIDFDPQPDYARVKPEITLGEHSMEIRWLDQGLRLFTNASMTFVQDRRQFVLDEPIFFVLADRKRQLAPELSEIEKWLEDTIWSWREWAKGCALSTFAEDAVIRSALCLKLHASQDTGAIIAAATTSIPEAMGTERTWDYRHCWLRDAAFVAEALRRLSHLVEGQAFVGFLRNVAELGPLQPLYGVGGEIQLTEHILPHLAGFGDNGFVRIGNAAAKQMQNDVHGEIILCLHTLLTDPRVVIEDPDAYFPLVQRLVEEAIIAAPKPDTSIWEFRSFLRHYTFSRAMCWVAVDRGADLARSLGHADLAEQWRTVAAREREEVLRRGYNAELGYFTQTLDGRHPDASLLLLPTLGLLDGTDPRFLSTLAAYEQRLVRRGLMLRYVNDDDFGETTSAFTMCSFWWAEALALAGRLDDAKALFLRLIEHRNPLGLLSEDVDPESGALLGNFPQAYTHVGLIHAALTIGELIEARDGRVRAWV